MSAIIPSGESPTDCFPGPGDLRFNILGTLEVRRGGVDCTPSPAKQKALLAILLMNANVMMPSDRLVEELWGSHTPQSAIATLQTYVSALRRTLDPEHGSAKRDPRRHPRLRTEGSGYVLVVRDGESDLDRFRSLVEAGGAAVREGVCHLAADSYRSALALFRGPVLTGLERSALPAHYGMRLEEERLAVLHKRIGADLCCEGGPELIGELAELCARYPLDEVFHGQLMLALNQAGRRAEALEVFRRARRQMLDDIGIEPGPMLQAAQEAILRGTTPENGCHRLATRPAPR